MKRRRGGDEGAEAEAGASADRALDTGARHYRDTKQVRSDIKAIQEKTLALLMSADTEAEGEDKDEDPRVAALVALGLDRYEAQERSWKLKDGQCSVCLVGGADDASVLECNYCQRDVCLNCLQRCQLCQQLFCTTCTTTNHELREDRLLCLSCHAEDLKQRRALTQPQPMEEAPHQ